MGQREPLRTARNHHCSQADMTGQEVSGVARGVADLADDHALDLVEFGEVCRVEGLVAEDAVYAEKLRGVLRTARRREHNA